LKRRKRPDTLGKVMSKVGQGLKLTKTESMIKAAAVDGARKAKGERRRKRKKGR